MPNALWRCLSTKECHRDARSIGKLTRGSRTTACERTSEKALFELHSDFDKTFGSSEVRTQVNATSMKNPKSKLWSAKGNFKLAQLEKVAWNFVFALWGPIGVLGVELWKSTELPLGTALAKRGPLEVAKHSAVQYTVYYSQGFLAS